MQQYFTACITIYLQLSRIPYASLLGTIPREILEFSSANLVEYHKVGIPHSLADIFEDKEFITACPPHSFV